MLAKPGSKIIEHKPYLFRLQQKVFFRLNWDVQVNNTQKKFSAMSKYKSCVSSEYVWASRCLTISSVLVRHAVPSQVRQLFWLRQKREENSDSKLKIKVLFLMRAQVWLYTMCICVVIMPNTDKQLTGCLRLSHRCKPHTAALLTDLGANTCTVTTSHQVIQADLSRA